MKSTKKFVHGSLVFAFMTTITTSAIADEYHLIAKHSNKCINVPGGAVANKTPIVQWGCGGGDNDNFILKNLGNGYFNLIPGHARNKCLDIDLNRRSQNSVQLELYQCGSGDNQMFQMRHVSDGYYQILSKVSGKCLDIKGADKKDGAAITQYDCKASWDSGKDNQLFRQLLVKEDKMVSSSNQTVNIPSPKPGEPVNIVSVHSWLCLDVKNNGGQGSPLIMYPCKAGGNQTFQIAKDGTVHVKGLCMDAFGGYGKNGDIVGAWGCNGGANQKWRITSAGELRGINNKCLDIKNENKLWWAEVVIYDCTGKSNQKWQALRVFNKTGVKDTGFNFWSGRNELSANLNNATPLIGNTGAALIGNAGASFSMTIGNNLTQVTPLANVTP